MKICILVSDKRHLNSAGVRIRYDDNLYGLVVAGNQINVLPIQDFKFGDHGEYDVVIISKCYSLRSIFIAKYLKNKNILVGIDLFDDYFSHTKDVRLSRYEQWLEVILEHIGFVFCSTPRIQKIAKSLAPGLPIYLLREACPSINIENIRYKLNQKLDVLNKTNILHVSWFGISQNQYFSVGLSDIVAFGSDLSRLTRSGMQVQLSILTNRSSIDVDYLTNLRRLNIPYRILEWSESLESELLEKSIVCFLPVNAQNFSTAKSLNRALTALASGNQVLSSGYPLYKDLSNFIYHTPEDLLFDLRNKTLALNDKTVVNFEDFLQNLMIPIAHSESINSHGEDIERFLLECMETKSSDEMVISNPAAMVISGPTKREAEQAFETVKDLDVILVSSPFNRHKLLFDIDFVFDDSEKELQVYIHNKLYNNANSSLRKYFVTSDFGGIYGADYFKVDLADCFPSLTCEGTGLIRANSIMSNLAGYHEVNMHIEKIVRLLFPDVNYFYSEYYDMPLCNLSYRKVKKGERSNVT